MHLLQIIDAGWYFQAAACVGTEYNWLTGKCFRRDAGGRVAVVQTIRTSDLIAFTVWL